MTENSATVAGNPGALLNRLYISQMLRVSGAFSARESFGGGAGEAQFSSFLREEIATQVADNLQILPASLLQK
ncbi:hypothetical protein [Salipiger sp. PrR002]|uniref:hypothetical protein n=1 Tax=Salipiger sp. PrR002 TaxID=2706489 RepID=UPI0013BE2D54|nr:hypothetical protein [Salipiger sp. PrR002]NDV98171.1 hypothetical protein [Salipiger sp. PrR002]NDW54883.1 hypothetical protein [Salipiger sp. PrR004]